MNQANIIQIHYFKILLMLHQFCIGMIMTIRR